MTTRNFVSAYGWQILTTVFFGGMLVAAIQRKADLDYVNTQVARAAAERTELANALKTFSAQTAEWQRVNRRLLCQIPVNTKDSACLPDVR